MAKLRRPTRQKETSLVSGIVHKKLYKLSSQLKIDYIKSGAVKQDLVDLKDELQIDYDELSRIFSVSRAKLIAKDKKDRFDVNTSEKIISLADLVSYGFYVFDDADKFINWFKMPAKYFGNKTPMSMVDTNYGITEVKNLLGRIEHGIY